ncbi:hypothetical protein LWI29_017261 [Acer saccharum]|uniref:Protein kinase domain-containing protein n=1 Tax=Acer saccharum TaxID=4024 RepID=A0AA39T092_ACESA|nr:hypothetical protein LWI29_017261 [Acer saccharum]
MVPFQRKEYREKQCKTKSTVKNGEILLEKLITTFDGKRNPFRNFSSKELKLATNNFDTMNVIMDRWFFKLYKGFLLDRQISVMKFRSESQRAYDSCINNIVFASQMCHKHILKLIGCCLETEVPILVFESLVKYGTLWDHIHSHHKETLSWRQRLKIAMEISHTFAYLHVGFPRPIVYSWMSSSKFLLDEHCVPKLFDFSHAECIPEGETQIKDAEIRGIIGFVAPEHISMAVLDEKCDVYGFGSLLLELLTGQRAIDILVSSKTEDEDLQYSSGTEDEDSGTQYHDLLGNFMKKINEDNRFIEAVDPIIVGDGLCLEIEQPLKVFRELAVKCLADSGEDRPTMIDAAKQLRQLYLSTS